MDIFTEVQTLAAIPRLTRLRLTAFVEARIVMPLQAETGPVFRQADLARIELLCELAEEFGLDEDGLGLVMSLLDQLHAARRDLRASPPPSQPKHPMSAPASAPFWRSRADAGADARRASKWQTARNRRLNLRRHAA